MLNLMDTKMLFTVVGGLVLCTNVVTEVLKSIFKKLPGEITAFIVAMILTIIAFFTYAAVNEAAIRWYMITEAVAMGFFVSYGAQFGFDKLTEIIKKYKGEGK